MDYNQIRFFILNNKESLSKEEIKTQLLKNKVSDAEIDLLINKFYIVDKNYKQHFLFSFLILIIIGFSVSFYLGIFNSISPNQNQLVNKVSTDYNSGLLPVELGVYGAEDGVIDFNSKDYFSFKFKLKKNYELINLNDLTLRIISRDKVVNYKFNPKTNNDYPFKIKKIIGYPDAKINPGDVFVLTFPAKIDINEDETFNLLFLKKDKVFNIIIIKTPQVMRTNYLILNSVY